MFARSLIALPLVVLGVACVHPEAPAVALPAAPEPHAHVESKAASSPAYCAYEGGLTGALTNGLYVSTLLHHSCRYGHIVEALRGRVAESCRAPLRALRDTLRADEALDQSHDCLVPEARDRFAELLAETAAPLVDPACIWKPTDPASANPRASECPLPTELYLELTTPEERARKARGEPVVPASYRSIPAGILAFVSAWSRVDDALFARLHQRELLVCDWDAKVELSPEGQCLVDGKKEEAP
jgi:hypothetical protein